MGDAERQAVGAEYGARYAVLPPEAETSLPVVASGQGWRVVELAP